MTSHDPVFIHLSDIEASIDADLMLPLKAHEREDRGGFFGISRQVFSYIDYLGALAFTGKCGTNTAVAYMEKYFTRANPIYAGKCKILHAMWRHGTVHEYDPQVFVSLRHGFQLRWGANNTSVPANRKWHLKCLCRKNKPDTYNWFMNLFELVEDLLKSVQYFSKDLRDNQTYLKKVSKNLEMLSAQIDLDHEQRSLLKEALTVVQEAAGAIDDGGNVIKEFNSTIELEEFKQNVWGTP